VHLRDGLINLPGVGAEETAGIKGEERSAEAVAADEKTEGGVLLAVVAGAGDGIDAHGGAGAVPISDGSGSGGGLLDLVVIEETPARLAGAGGAFHLNGCVAVDRGGAFAKEVSVTDDMSEDVASASSGGLTDEAAEAGRDLASNANDLSAIAGDGVVEVEGEVEDDGVIEVGIGVDLQPLPPLAILNQTPVKL
jgi:hypothetical protein